MQNSLMRYAYQALYYPSSAEKIGQFSLPCIIPPVQRKSASFLCLVLSLQCRENRPVFSACSPHAVSGLGF
ncbi:hypothetical protein AW081_25675 [Escherichia coli]|nr:hypothetical protein AW081_25675 [Escherichia coli]